MNECLHCGGRGYTGGVTGDRECQFCINGVVMRSHTPECNEGRCFTPWCRCWCHRERTEEDDK